MVTLVTGQKAIAVANLSKMNQGAYKLVLLVRAVFYLSNA